MSEEAPDDFSLHSLDFNAGVNNASLRSSIDYATPETKSCQIAIFDQQSSETEVVPFTFHIPPGRPTTLPEELKTRLLQRDATKTRWINFTQWSSPLADELANLYLDNHSCLDLHTIGTTIHGGPIKCRDDSTFVWTQTLIPYLDQHSKSWSTLQQCGFKMVICLPSQQQAGTIITNFTGKADVVERISRAMTTTLLDDHAMGAEALICVWLLASSIIHRILQQLDLAFQIFDPLDIVPIVAHVNRLPVMLEQVNDLARIDRYASSLAEILSFFDAVQTFQGPGSPLRSRHGLSARSKLECEFVKQKVTVTQQLCKTYIKQYQSHVQIMLSYSATQIADRLDQGRKIAERIAVIGVVLAAISGLTSPLAVLTGYFGMNVKGLTDDGLVDLFEFWQIALPMLAITVFVLVIIVLRIVTGSKTHSILSRLPKR